MPVHSVSLPGDYQERVYAGVLGKLIGVYLGRPFEGWNHQRIIDELGEVDSYVHERFNVPLVVTDDDIAGTFTFLRALEDNGYDPELSPARIGEAWLNYIIEGKTILWWGGIGNSTEHTAYLRLSSGIAAPESGSIARNGKTIAEQIGAQTFIDGWAMLFPGDPERAVDFARRAASVSHDGEAVHGAQVVAALEAQAFVETDINALLDTAVSLIPADSIIARLIHDVRDWHAAEPDWYVTRRLIERDYGYDSWRGACHIVPNHALIIHALLHGNGDFQRSLMIVNTSGWDTDCNSGNVGAILGIRNGLAGIDSSPIDWRGPVADRLYLSTAEGGRGISDAAIESMRIVNAGRALQGLDPARPKSGARFHFSLPGSVQGFQSHDVAALTVGNTDGRLAFTLHNATEGIASTPTYIPPEALELHGYTLFASPTLYPGQTVTADIIGAAPNHDPVTLSVVLQSYDAHDNLACTDGPSVTLIPGEEQALSWRIPPLGGMPVASIGFRLEGSPDDTVYVDRLNWGGAPSVVLGRPDTDSTIWRRAWVNGVNQWDPHWREDYRIVQNRGTGLISQGTEDWVDYTVTADVTIPLAESAGIAARVGGLRRYYALVVCRDGYVRLIRMRDTEHVLAKAPFAWDPDATCHLELTVHGTHLRGTVDGVVFLDAIDTKDQLARGAAGLVVREGTLISGPVTIAPAPIPLSL